MQLRLLALLSLSAIVSASVVGRHAAQPQPSSTPPSYTCPDYNNYGHSKVSELCDYPPHSGSLFGCTYRTGRGTGTHACTYNTKTGSCTSNDSRCPSTATTTHSYRRQDTSAF
ncbi:hypothetical protein B0H11DRAFT_2046004 [Mycena galericulata]|nr:hypothetical protein B0H11DRAFT_2046004 [Mycena galericulata]